MDNSLRKAICNNGHKWLPHIAGFETCPKCGNPPVPQTTAEQRALGNYQPPANHGCHVVQLDGETTVFMCRR